jgi:colanic acid/amylovoran biosynthesis protein
MGKALNKPVVIYAQSIGPFTRRLSKILTRFTLERIDLIILRDEYSKQELEAIGLKNKQIYVTIDAAVQQPSITKDDAICILDNIDQKYDGISDKNIGMSLLKWGYPSSENPLSKYREYVKTMAEFADYIIEQTNGIIWFICTNTEYGGNRSDDIEVANDVLQVMKHSERGRIIDRVLTPSEMKGVIGLMDYFIATRMHSCIFATTQLVPTISITYEFKSFEFMRSLGLEKYTYDINAMHLNELKELWDNLVENNVDLRLHLRDSLLLLEEKAELSAKHVDSLVMKLNLGS